MNGQLVELKTKIAESKSHFLEIAEVYGKVNFKSEAMFALQALESNEFLTSVASRNPGTLKNAIINVASTGLSLNPVKKQAYLVPMKNEVVLFVSYMGLVHLATEAGAIDWVDVQLVKQNDEFMFNGPGKMPTHSHNPFSDRGEIIGVYCVAKLPSGEYLTEIMSIEEVNEIRGRSKSYDPAKKTSPWVTDYGEMVKKTVIKRAAKLWPSKSKSAELLNEAIGLDNKHYGIDFKEISSDSDLVNLDPYKNTPESGPDYIARSTKFRGKKLSDIPREELESFIDSTEAKIEKGTYRGNEKTVSIFIAKAADYLENWAC